MAKAKQKAKKGTMKKALAYIGKYKYLLPVSIFFALITVALTLYLPILIGDAIDLITLPGQVKLEEIAAILLRGVGIIALTALSQWLMSTINNHIAYNVVRDIRNDVFAKIEHLPLSYLDKCRKGDIVNRVINDSDQFAEGLLLGFTQVFTGVITIVGTLAFMLYVNWIIAVIVVVLTPLSLLVARFIAKRTYSMFRLRSECEGAATAYIDERIGNQKTVKAFSREDESIEEFNRLNEKLSKSTLRAIFFSSLTNPATRFVNSVVYAAVALAGALMVAFPAGTGAVAAVLTVGRLSSLLAYANQYTKPFNEISGVITEFQNSLACVGRVLELAEEPSEVPDAPDAKVLTDARGNVEMTDVSFLYTPDRPLIENLNLNVKEGQKIAIVGPTGCGKTTLINLLMRFYDVKGGAISVDGTDIRNITRHSLRDNLGMVLQDTWLKSGTVRENILMGKPDATDEEMIAAAKASHAHSFIKRLAKGYDTYLSEGGGELSAGQKQLLCITRVMLALPPVLILDEATSSIDTRTEMRIQKAFGAMTKGRTSFIVAHRLSTVRDADVILVMKDGSIIEIGNHEELLARRGFYFTLYNSQFAH